MQPEDNTLTSCKVRCWILRASKFDLRLAALISWSLRAASKVLAAPPFSVQEAFILGEVYVCGVLSCQRRWSTQGLKNNNNKKINKLKKIFFPNIFSKNFGSGGIRTHAIEMTGALNQRLRPLGHATKYELMHLRNCSHFCSPEYYMPT